MNRLWWVLLGLGVLLLVTPAGAVTASGGAPSGAAAGVSGGGAAPDAAASIVGITVTVSPRAGAARPEYRRGTGVVVQPGYLVTDAGLFPGAQAVHLFLPDGRAVAVDVGRIRGDRLAGVAVLPVPDLDLPAAPLAAGVPPRGSRVLVLTAGAGGRPATAVAGTVAGTDRRLGTGRPFLQLGVRTTLGAAGAPVLDAGGALVGLVTHKVVADGVEGMAFAVPVPVLLPIVETVRTRGQVTRAWLGVALAEDGEAQMAIPGAGAVIIAGVHAAGPAAGKLQAGMVLQGLGGVPIHTSEDVAAVLLRHRPGQPITVDVKRGAVQQSFRLLLGEQPPLPADLEQRGVQVALNGYEQVQSLYLADAYLHGAVEQLAGPHLAYTEHGVAYLQTEFARLAYVYWQGWRLADDSIFHEEPRHHAARAAGKFYIPVWLALAERPPGTVLATLSQGDRNVGETRTVWLDDPAAVGMPRPRWDPPPGTAWHGLQAIISHRGLDPEGTLTLTLTWADTADPGAPASPLTWRFHWHLADLR